jgi:hypothetical protein
MSVILRDSISSESRAQISQAIDDAALLAGFTLSHTSTLTTTTTIAGTTTG